MNAVTYLLIYAVALSWLAPTVLSRLASDGVSPRLAVTGWLTTVATALFAWGAALVILVVGAAHSLITHTALTFCVETLGITEAVEFPPVVATVLTGALLAVTAAVAVRTAHRVVVAMLKVRRANRRHTEAVRIIGRPTGDDDVVVVTAEQPTAYCVSGGRRRAIVITTSALALLKPPELAAVLAHERAHLRGHHHHVVAVLTALSAALPQLPLMRGAIRSVPALLEMCADDASIRTHGRAPLLASLVVLGTRHGLPDGALAAAGTAVADRALRLMQPPHQSRWQPKAMLMSLVVVATLSAPSVALTLCVH
ncbi:peptidase M48 like-protein [Mycolicibacterium mageritense DSM 44476 = CIP 104973]|uniref:Peptidase M48 domain-containing protein n=1 Tax=Mycolicibacterium mageritense TaxID=53462 RepID=A0ABM7HPA8_MYCME|nr:M56 family metallopeptidase [Mycolicibacterium mageritense]MBN3455001.1 M48 family metalloprotease [Mycobacterium sp. DSM 3803]TXH17147.1 MAG: M56 family peptidase [Mycobacterium sp.]MCC9180622.1 M48 family metalloprotease [Mycolicibacterium mageritense]CDO23085.1 peptidase M48 like-protein [Mycolicibacterium mageritense DSM 44476 = CIP 104973]BBX32372.1 hypothetical protein MMAGJ_16540 [Mycolicibacterium mageritense]